MKRDSDLEPLRSREDFQQLLRELNDMATNQNKGRGA
jgi:hypothetical protein